MLKEPLVEEPTNMSLEAISNFRRASRMLEKWEATADSDFDIRWSFLNRLSKNGIVQKPLARAMARQYAFHPDSTLRDAAVEILARSDEAEDFFRLQFLMKDPEWVVRCTVVQGFLNSTAPEARKHLITMLRHDTHKVVRSWAVEALASTGLREGELEMLERQVIVEKTNYALQSINLVLAINGQLSRFEFIEQCLEKDFYTRRKWEILLLGYLQQSLFGEKRLPTENVDMDALNAWKSRIWIKARDLANHIEPPVKWLIEMFEGDYVPN